MDTMNEAMRNLISRRSVRQYLDKPVPEDILKLRAAAPDVVEHAVKDHPDPAFMQGTAERLQVIVRPQTGVHTEKVPRVVAVAAFGDECLDYGTGRDRPFLRCTRGCRGSCRSQHSRSRL